MTVEISAATMEDVPSVVAIEQEAFSDPWTAIAFQDALAHPAVYFACARSGEREVVGYVVAWFAADEGEIANLAVAATAFFVVKPMRAARRAAELSEAVTAR